MTGKVTISDQGKQFIEKGQLWMYRNNLLTVSDGTEDGDAVQIVDQQGKYLASGFYSSCSHIVVRIVSHDPNEEIDEEFFRRRINKAYQYRREVMGEQITNCRLIYGQSDGLDGLTVDRYNDVLVSQLTCAYMEKHKDMIYRLLKEVLGKDGEEIRVIYERNDLAARQKEGLEAYKGFYGTADQSVTTVIRENGIKINVDFANGQKTGYFLDQKFNRKYIQEIAKDRRVMDCFCHTGGFALNAAKGGASKVTAVDLSPRALQLAYENACINDLEKQIEFVQADVFEYLSTVKKGEYDIIILDPPAFTKSRRTIDHAYQGYLRINQKAMDLLADGAILVSCSCSRYMEKADFEKMLREAADNSNVSLKMMANRGQSPDHPTIDGDETTSYLKFYVMQIERRAA